MGSQKQSHRVRKFKEDNIYEYKMLFNKIGEKQLTLYNLIEQNHRLVEKVAWHENRPPWWKFSERRKWREAGR